MIKTSRMMKIACVFVVSAHVMAAESPIANAAPITVASEAEASKFPDPKSTYINAVQRYDVDDIKKLNLGLNKNQVRFLLGNPHFSEGIFVVKTWDYLIGLKKANSNDYQVCQLRVHFDHDNLVDSLKWRDSSCEWATQEEVVAKAQDIAMEQKASDLKSYVLNTILFNFDKSGSNDVVGGTSMIDHLVDDIHSNFKSVQQIVVTGYADRLGKSDYNAALSQARAKTIADALVNRGLVSATSVQATGQGATSEFSACNGVTSHNNQIRCLEPNRRVSVKVIGD